MKAIILAAGRGSRMKDHTIKKPKCFVNLGGKALLDWQVQALHAADIHDIAVVRGYLPDTFDCRNFKACFDNLRWSETNMVRSLQSADSWLRSEACIISYSDIVYHSSIVSTLEQAEGSIVVAYDTDWYRLWSERFTDPLEDAETFRVDGYGHLAEIGEKAKTIGEIGGQYIGLIKCTPQGWKAVTDTLMDIPPNEVDKLDMTALLSLLIRKGVTITTVGIRGQWCETDDASDLNLYENKINGESRWHHDWREKQVGAEGSVLWITGLSGVGKTTLATEAQKILCDQGSKSILLDGDKIRAAIADPLVAHDRESRITNAMRICRLSQMLSDQGFVVLVATMSLFQEVHAWNRENITDYFEVYVRASLESLKQRDARTLYSRATDGAVKDVVGLHLEFNEPKTPHYVIDNEGNDFESIQHKARQILEAFNARRAGA